MFDLGSKEGKQVNRVWMAYTTEVAEGGTAVKSAPESRLLSIAPKSAKPYSCREQSVASAARRSSAVASSGTITLSRNSATAPAGRCA